MHKYVGTSIFSHANIATLWPRLRNENDNNDELNDAYVVPVRSVYDSDNEREAHI